MTVTAANPLRAGARLARAPEPSILVIFGGNGDLAQRKLLPALYNLALQRLLPASFAVVGTARQALTEDHYRAEVRDAIVTHSRTKPINEDVVASFLEHVHYVSSADDAGYVRLGRKLADLDASLGTNGNRLFYLATPPAAYAPIVASIGRHGLSRTQGWARIVVEKPFGRDLRSALDLSMKVYDVFNEDRVFRIDHYLGKETVQNILVMRFANGIFEPLWTRQYVDHVQITVAESLGMEERAAYYESAGAIRDIVQNHMLQLLTLVAMEPPAAFEANAVRDEKVKVLRALRPITAGQAAERTVRAQYLAGSVEGERVRGYREESGVSPTSHTESYVALKCYVDNWRWQGTPFYLRTGKRLPKRTTEIALQFRAAPHQVFSSGSAADLEPNALVMRIQPDEGLTLKIGAKVPVQGVRIRSVNMDFDYGASFMVDAPDAYETLILDALRGDATLFTRRDEVEQQWRFIDPIVEAWAASDVPPASYAAGTWGPPEADALLARDGRSWRRS
ncbi:MAG TPA: glucose-6-phosphate dehydrogenase [Candidatus Limnocylindria bacterium]|nr:glucose-6-phosphate dehydrogenase [Candidatus Limnocylindria bacterium]